MTNLEVLERIAALMPIASQDQTRHHINGVAIESIEPGRARLLVTDGHRLIIEPISTSLFDALTSIVLINRSHAPLVKLAIKQPNDEINLSTAGESIFAGNVAIPFDSSIKYPSVDALVPKIDSTCASIGFNAKYLLELQKALSGKLNRNNGIKIQFKDALSPIVVSCGERQAVLMPMRI